MLTITVEGVESFDNDTQLFSTSEDVVLHLEHSLVSLSKWESRFLKPFLGGGAKTTEETLGYIQAMSLTDEIPPEVLQRLSQANLKRINEHIESKMTATWFNEVAPQSPFKVQEVITSEVIYYWLVALQIPFECETWHLNRLITLVKVINEKNAAASNAKKKAPTRSNLDARRALNEQRRKQSGTTG